MKSINETLKYTTDYARELMTKKSSDFMARKQKGTSYTNSDIDIAIAFKIST